MAETLLVDQARRDDTVLALRGARPTAEADLRALLSPAVPDDTDEAETEVTNIVDFAAFVTNLSRAQNGTADA